MKKTFWTALACLLGILAVVGGILIGLSMVAYSIYLTILMIKGTIACTFFGVFKVVLCLILSVFCGWLWGLLFGFLSAFCKITADDTKKFLKNG